MLGTIRVLVIAPALRSETVAVILELPLMLLASWFAARRLVARHAPMPLKARLAMGGLAFALLMGAEAVLAVSAFGQTVSEWAASLSALPGIIGLAGQLGFALMPALARGDGAP